MCCLLGTHFYCSICIIRLSQLVVVDQTHNGKMFTVLSLPQALRFSHAFDDITSIGLASPHPALCEMIMEYTGEGVSSLCLTLANRPLSHRAVSLQY